MLHSSSWRLPPSSPWDSLSTSLPERKPNVRAGTEGAGEEAWETVRERMLGSKGNRRGKT